MKSPGRNVGAFLSTDVHTKQARMFSGLIFCDSACIDAPQNLPLEKSGAKVY